MSSRNRIAPDGHVWVCAACGKQAHDLYGDGAGEWDESCMMNAILCNANYLRLKGGRVVEVLDGGIVEDEGTPPSPPPPAPKGDADAR